MVLNIGGFKFEWKQTLGIDMQTDFSIESIDRIENHPTLLSAALESQTISVSAQTLPFRNDGQNTLKALYILAATRQSYPLVGGNGRYFGRFAIIKISEKRAIFTPNGAFLTQNFTMELKRDYDI